MSDRDEWDPDARLCSIIGEMFHTYGPEMDYVLNGGQKPENRWHEFERLWQEFEAALAGVVLDSISVLDFLRNFKRQTAT